MTKKMLKILLENNSFYAIQILMFVCNAIFVVYIFTLSLHSRLSLCDDYRHLLILQEKGIFWAIQNSYESFGGRIFPYTIYYFFLQNLSVFSHFFVYIFVLFALYVIGFYRLCSRFLSANSSKLLILNVALLTIGGIFQVSLEFSVHFWLIGSVFYSFAFAMGIIAFAETFSNSSHWLSYLAIFFGSAFAANSIETYSISVFLFLTVYLFYLFRKQNKNIHFSKIRFLWIVWAIFLLVLALSPANFQRLQSHGILSFSELLYRVRQNTPYFFVDALPKVQSIFPMLFFIYLFLGSLFAHKKSKLKIILPLFVGIFGIFLFILLGIALTSFMLGGSVGHDRTLNYLFYVLFLYFAYIVFLLGKYSGINVVILQWFAIFSLFFYAYRLYFNHVNHTYATKILSEEQDQRIEYLLDLEKKSHLQTVAVPTYSLRTSRFMFVEISTDSSKNQLFKEALGLHFDVVLKP